MYMGYDNISAPEAIPGIKPFIGSQRNIDIFYWAVSNYKRWLITQEAGQEELLSEMDFSEILNLFPDLVGNRNLWAADSCNKKITMSTVIGQRIDEEAEILAHKWARSHMDELMGPLNYPDFMLPWELP